MFQSYCESSIMYRIRLLTLIAAVHLSNAANMTTENRLAQDLLKDYDHKIRPVVDPTTVMKLQMGLVLQSTNIVETKTHGTLMFCALKLTMRWKDELIHWNPADYEGITTISFSDREIWTPTISVLDKISVPRAPYTYRTILLDVDETGNVTQLRQTEYITSCKHHYEHWPLDRLTCKLRFSAPDYPDLLRLEYWAEFEDDPTGESSLIIHTHSEETFPSAWSQPPESSDVCVDRNITTSNGATVTVCDKVYTLIYYRLTNSFFDNICVPYFLLFLTAWLSVFIHNDMIRILFMGISTMYQIRMIRVIWMALIGSVNKDITITWFFRNQIYLTVFMLAVTIVSLSIKSMKTSPSRCLKSLLSSRLAKLMLCKLRLEGTSSQNFSLEREESQLDKTHPCNTNSWLEISLLIDRTLILIVPPLYAINYIVFYPS